MSKKKPLSEKSPKFTVPEIIEYCKNDLGITFNLMDEEKTKAFIGKRFEPFSFGGDWHCYGH